MQIVTLILTLFLIKGGSKIVNMCLTNPTNICVCVDCFNMYTNKVTLLHSEFYENRIPKFKLVLELNFTSF